MERLARQIQESQQLLQQPETDWKDCSSSIEELATAVESLGRAEDNKDAVRLLLSLSSDIGMQISSIRSKLVKDVCEHILRIVKVTGRDFQDMANALLPQIVNTAKSASAAIRQPGSKLLSKMSELVRYDLSLMRKIYVQLMQDKARVLVLEQLRIVFVYWSHDEVLPWESDVLEIVRRGLDDQHDKVRKAAREVLCTFSSKWSEHVDELVEMLSNHARTLLINEHRDSPLAAAIMDKYPELATKSETLSRSRSSFTKSRANFHKSPRHKREQSIDIRVFETPPPKQREQQEAMAKETHNSEVTTSTSRTVATPERTEPASSAIARRLSDYPNLSGGSDDDLQDDTPKVFDGSQMHGFRSKPKTPETAQSPTSEIDEIPTPPAAIHSRAAVARSSSASSVEEASLQHPSIRQLKDSKIPSPSSRSPSFLNRKHLESPTRASSSPERPSLLPRPGSFTLKARGSTGPSTPVSANIEEEKIEPNPLSASDEYFSKPIPSSLVTPTPPSPSTDSVTLRPRRRTLAQQEQEDSEEDSPFRTYSPVLSSPELPAPDESVQPRQVETTPESIVCSSQLNHEAVPLREQYADYVFDEEDDIGHLTEGSDHAESDNEWVHRRLDDCRSHDDYNGSMAEYDNQPKPSGEDIFSDEWRLDEGPRHKLDFKDEIGDRLSDDQTNFVGGVDDDHTTTTNEPKVSDMEWHQHAGSSLLGDFSMSSDNDEEEGKEGELSVEVITENLHTDALTRLLNVRNEMTRLRATTRNDENSNGLPFKERYAPAFDTAATTEEAQEQFPMKCDIQPWGEPKRAGPSYFDRLTQADHFARSPLLAPPVDAAREQAKESGLRGRPPSPSQTFEQDSFQTATIDVTHKGSEENNFLGTQAPHSPPRVFEHASARIDEPGSFDLAKKPRLAERAEAHLPNPQKVVQPQDSIVAHEQTGRFDAAERLFAAKEVPSTHGYYNRPQSPEPELYMHSEPRQERFPPTQLGAKLDPSYANAQKNMVDEDGSEIDRTPKDVAAEGVTAVADAEMEATPEEDHREVSPKECRPVPSFVETSKMPAPEANKNDASPSTSDTVARSTSKPSTVAPERNASPGTLGWASSIAITIAVFLAAIFCMAGILRAAKTVHDSHKYHLALKTRIDKFEASIAESHEQVLKLEKDYAIWSDYVRKLTEEDEVHALTQLEAIQLEVQKWQQDMKADLVAFRQALSVDSIEASFADMRMNNTKQIEQ